MSTNINNALRLKEAILSTIRIKGPMLPINIARDVKTSTLFASAFLSELYQERKLLMSHLKVGSTSLYLLPGQEDQLENFIQFLNHKEQEAFHLLKNSGTLDESLLQPAIRVAIKEIKDFAHPIQQQVNGEIKTMWRYAFLKDNPSQQQAKQAMVMIPSNPNIPNSIQHAVESQLTQQVQETRQIPQNQISVQPSNSIIQPASQITSPLIEKELTAESITKTKKERKPYTKTTQPSNNLQFSLTEPSPEPIKEETQFGKEVRKYCKHKEINILSIEEETKKDFTAILEVNTPLGKHNFFCIAKDKKRINEQDIQIALQKAQQMRMPVLLLISAPLDKKGLSIIGNWSNLIKVDKLK